MTVVDPFRDAIKISPDLAGTPSLIERLAEWAAGLQLDDVPERVVAHARSQILSQLAAARAGYGHKLGRPILDAAGPPSGADARQAAYALAIATVSLDFDDTTYAGHVSHSAVNVPLAYAGPLGLDGRQLLTAVIAASECAARITASATLGRFRGQTAAYAHLAGSVAGRLRAENASPQLWADALALAFCYPPWTLTRAFSTDAKILAAAVGVRSGLDACDLARSGLTGPPDILERPAGFLDQVADIALPAEISDDLGQRWHTETLSYKRFPGNAYVSAAIDCAIALHGRTGPVHPDSVAEIVVAGSVLTTNLHRATARHLHGPDTNAIVASISVPYSVAIALQAGWLEPGDFEHPALTDPGRWQLADKVAVVHDPDLTRRALAATAPVGQALSRAGDRAQGWIHDRLGAEAAQLWTPSRPVQHEFSKATKSVGAQVTVRFADGRTMTEERPAAVGAAGGGDDHAALARAKFLQCGGSPETADQVLRLDTLTAAQTGRLIASELKDLSVVTP
jgi:2-methylcitrate dehydratase PrpD